jgi:hypothetical protein
LAKPFFARSSQFTPCWPRRCWHSSHSTFSESRDEVAGISPRGECRRRQRRHALARRHRRGARCEHARRSGARGLLRTSRACGARSSSASPRFACLQRLPRAIESSKSRLLGLLHSNCSHRDKRRSSSAPDSKRRSPRGHQPA